MRSPKRFAIYPNDGVFHRSWLLTSWNSQPKALASLALLTYYVFSFFSLPYHKSRQVQEQGSGTSQDLREGNERERERERGQSQYKHKCSKKRMLVLVEMEKNSEIKIIGILPLFTTERPVLAHAHLRLDRAPRQAAWYRVVLCVPPVTPNGRSGELGRL